MPQEIQDHVPHTFREVIVNVALATIVEIHVKVVLKPSVLWVTYHVVGQTITIQAGVMDGLVRLKISANQVMDGISAQDIIVA